MVDVIKSQLSEMLLSREQLHQIEHFQAQVGELERELTGTVDDFISVLNRHYFNRENGYLDEQQGNLREVVIIQSRLEKLAGKLAACTGELKTYMMALQKSLHGKAVEEPVEPKGKAEESAAAGVCDDLLKTLVVLGDPLFFIGTAPVFLARSILPFFGG